MFIKQRPSQKPYYSVNDIFSYLIPFSHGKIYNIEIFGYWQSSFKEFFSQQAFLCSNSNTIAISKTCSKLTIKINNLNQCFNKLCKRTSDQCLGNARVFYHVIYKIQFYIYFIYFIYSLSLFSRICGTEMRSQTILIC